MNKIYKLVWNSRLNAMVAVSETSRGRGKESSKTTMIAAVAGTLLYLGAVDAGAACTPSVSGSTATLSGSNTPCVLSTAGQNFVVGAGATVSGTDAFGIATQNGVTVVGSVTNQGLISVQSQQQYPAYSRGIALGGHTLGASQVTVSGDIWNAAGATISVTNGGAAIDIQSGFNGSTYVNSTVTGGIVNDGTIVGGGMAIGGTLVSNGIHNFGQMVNSNMEIAGSSTILGGITNTGSLGGVTGGISIFNSAVVDRIVNGFGAEIQSGITIGGLGTGTVTGDITNAGTINGGSSYGLANIQGLVTGSVVNSGLITGYSGIHVAAQTSYYTSSGISTFGGNISGGVRNTGQIIGTSYAGIELAGGTIAGGVVNMPGATISGQGSGIALSAKEWTMSTGSSTIGTGTAVARLTGGITNSGLISGVANAGIMLSNSVVEGGIHNLASGTISGGQDGIRVGGYATTGSNPPLYAQSPGTLSGGIVNDGLMQGEFGAAIRVTGSTIIGDVVNNATVNGGSSGFKFEPGLVGPTSMPMYVRNTVNGSIINNGLLQGGSIAGIDMTTTDMSGRLMNHAGGTIAGYNGVDIRASTIAQGIVNQGVIIAAGGDGLRVGGMELTNSLISYGIVNTGVITGANALRVDGATISGGIANLAGGIISGDTGVRVSGTAQVDSMSNAGLISGSVKALDLRNIASAFAVANSGTLAGVVGLGINRLDILGNAAAVTGDVAGTSGSSVHIGVDSEARATFTPAANFVGLSNFVIHEGSTLNSRDGLSVGATTFTNAGTLSVANGHAINISGDYVQVAGGLFRTGLSSATSYGKLAVSGNANLSASSAVDVNVFGAPVLADGTVVPGVITASGTLTTANTITVTDNSYLFDFIGVKNGNALDLVIQRASSPAPEVVVAPQPSPSPATTVSAAQEPVPAASPAPASPAPAATPAPVPVRVANTVSRAVSLNNNTPGVGAASVLDTFIANGAAGDMQNAVTALGKLSTAAQVSGAVQQLTPLVNGGAAASIASTMNLTDRVVQARIESNRGLSAGDDTPAGKNAWVKPFGSYAKQGERNGVSGYTAGSGGLIVGVDGVVSPTDRVGAAFTYAHTNLHGSGAPNSANIDMYQGMLYGSHNFDEVTDLSWQADVGRNSTEGKRGINFGGLNRTAESHYRGTAMHVGVGLGRVLHLNEKTNVTPSVRLDYTTVKNDGYTESGAGALNLQVQDQRAKQLIVYADAKANRQISEELLGSVNLGVGYDFLAKQDSVTSSFAGGGASFVTKGFEPTPLFVRAGAGITLHKGNGLEVTARYDAEAHRSFTNQTVSVKLRKAF